VKKIRIPDNLTTLAYKSIKDHIWEGDLDEGARLTEEQLSKMLGISKSPVREALNRLEAEGLVRIEPRRGAYVRVFSAKEIEDLYEIREVLETHVVETVEVTPELVAQLWESVRQMERYFQAGEKYRYLEEAGNFHSLLARGTGNDLLVKTLENLYQQVWVFRRKTYDISRAHALDLHAMIVTALEKRDRREARRLMKDHIGAVRRKLLASLERRDAGANRPGRHHGPVRTSDEEVCL
jgi:DNA-binding GntR family transcriptional regulator